ncbi:MAG TPA: carboxypeptidase-like regulatory domain-containing protein [Bacteroidales bacterium]|nr:carboxypeptidase-like regulatory domain-containing protein [Bacteroidales bacterium]
MKKTFLIWFLILCAGYRLSAQGTASVTGRITDENREPVANVNISLRNLAGGTATGINGEFTLAIPGNTKIILVFSYLGFRTDSTELMLKPGEKKSLEITLHPAATQLESVEVRDHEARTSSFNRLNPKVVTAIPTPNASIEDLIKTLPGVSSRNELSSQYSVRGGNFDENLVFVNDIEIYRPFLVRAGQQEGLSFLNPDLVSAISFSAGGFDARFGDKMSSVLDIKYKRPTSFAGSFDISLLGADAHVEGTISKKFSYLIGARYKTNTYFFKGLQTKGDYKPRYFDLQALLNYNISKKWELSVLGTYSINSFKLIPETRETSFGTLSEAYKITMYFDGQEVDNYQNWLGAVTLSFKPRPNVRLRLISSIYQTFERETYDISAEYWLGRLEVYSGSDNGQVTEALGVGAFLQHARNYLDGTVFNIEHLGVYDREKSQIQWGIGYQHEDFTYIINEWEIHDSAGYSVPRPPDSVGSPNPPHDPFTIYASIKSNNVLSTNLLNGFLMDTWTFHNPSNEITLTAGLRGIYYDFNNQFLLNPRASVSLKPLWKHEFVFRLAAGYYSQPPTFRELTNLQGEIVPGLVSQNSLQVVGGSDYYFKGWGRIFKLGAEVYYKHIDHLIPYEVDNLQIRYYGTNDAHGYTTGIDFRIDGEFVKGAESWASVSFMTSQEKINGDWVPSPTDQRLNLAIFFQDYIPKFPTWRVNLTFIYGTGLPFGPPGAPKNEQTLRMPPYRRVDLGLSKQLIGGHTKFSPKNPLRVFTSMWIALEVFNLLDINNTVSYLWVTDINGRQYAVPNYLTPREFNLKLSATF